MDIRRLSAPFDSGVIHWRVGSTTQDKTKGMALAYIDARDVMQRLDSVCGPHAWQCDYPWSDGKKVVCRIGISIDREWVWKTNGAGDTDYEGDKGSLSDAFKRAGVLWGIGRYLYETPNWWAEIKKQGKSYVFVDGAIKDLNEKMAGHLTPYYKTRFQQAYKTHRTAVDAMADAILAKDLKAANDYWRPIPEADKEALWLAKSSGGLLDQDIKRVMQSTEFRLAGGK